MAAKSVNGPVQGDNGLPRAYIARLLISLAAVAIGLPTLALRQSFRMAAPVIYLLLRMRNIAKKEERVQVLRSREVGGPMGGASGGGGGVGLGDSAGRDQLARMRAHVEEAGAPTKHAGTTATDIHTALLINKQGKGCDWCRPVNHT